MSIRIRVRRLGPCSAIHHRIGREPQQHGCGQS